MASYVGFFADQHIIAICVEEKGIVHKTILIYFKLSETQFFLTHKYLIALSIHFTIHL